MQSLINCNISIINVWLSIKKSEFHGAWCFLVDAEDYLMFAKRVVSRRIDFAPLENAIAAIQTIVFPPPNPYLSSGMIHESPGVCSVCDVDFGSCEHLEGLIYWGKVCKRLKVKMVADHISIVDEPFDRRCIVGEIGGENGFARECLTWKMTDKPMEDGTFRGMVHSFNELDVLD